MKIWSSPQWSLYITHTYSCEWEMLRSPDDDCRCTSWPGDVPPSSCTEVVFISVGDRWGFSPDTEIGQEELPLEFRVLSVTVRVSMLVVLLSGAQISVTSADQTNPAAASVFAGIWEPSTVLTSWSCKVDFKSVFSPVLSVRPSLFCGAVTLGSSAFQRTCSERVDSDEFSLERVVKVPLVLELLRVECGPRSPPPNVPPSRSLKASNPISAAL